MFVKQVLLFTSIEMGWDGSFVFEKIHSQIVDGGLNFPYGQDNHSEIDNASRYK